MEIKNGVLRKVDPEDIVDGSFVIPESVTEIGRKAFFGRRLTKVEIPNSVTKIGERAFCACERLTKVEIPNSVTEIGKSAFNGCERLTKVEIPNSVTVIEQEAFWYCERLTKVEIPNSVTVIEPRVFMGCSRLTKVEIPNSVTKIGAEAFSRCSSLTKVEIPNSVTKIEAGAFRGCSSLTQVEIPNSVTKINWHTFSRCSRLTKVEIPNSVTVIAGEAFSECSRLTKVEIPNSVTEIGKDAFSGCSSLTKVEIPNSVTEIRWGAFSECSSLTQVEIPNSVTLINWDTFRGCSRLTKVEIPNSVTKIGERAFSGCSSLTQVEIPNSVTQIVGGAFSECSSLTKVEIPNSVTKIGGKAFSECSSLTQVEIPNSVTEIGEEAFSRCSSLTQVEIPNSVTEIREEAFSECSSLIQVEIPNSVTEIRRGAFWGCSSLTKIEILNSVTVIGQGAFGECSSLTQVEIPNSITEIGWYAFKSCSSLTNVEIPNSVTEIGNDAFWSCSSLTQVEIPNSVTKIGERAFSGCSSLTNIEISDTASTDFRIQLCKALGKDEHYEMALKILYKENWKRMKKIKEKSQFHLSADYDEQQMDMFYIEMINSIGIDEVEKIVELPNLTAEEIKQYTLEKDESFQELYDTKYKITGDLGITLKILKQLQLEKNGKSRAEKNRSEMQIFKAINEQMESGYNGSLSNLIETILRDRKIDIEPEVIEEIRRTEESTNKALIREHLERVGIQIEECLSTPNEQYPDPIVLGQVGPVKIMINDTIEKIFRRDRSIDIDVLRQELGEKIEQAGAPYIRQNKGQIVDNVIGLFANSEFSNIINHSCMDAIKHTKEGIGGAWRYKIIQSLGQLGYGFDNLPESFSKEEIEKITELLGKRMEIRTDSVSTPKKGVDREEAYKLLANKNLPKIVTYKQIHDMFGSVHEPYSEKFREFYKQHRKEFLENPKYYGKFGQIHNNFDTIVNSPELKNIYQKGELTPERIIGYMETKQYVGQREGDEELARLSKSVGNIVTDEEFKFVQGIFDITRQRERTTIPQTEVAETKYRGRMLSPDDVLNLFAGNITSCCQRFGDNGEGAMLLGSIEENGGIFVIEELDEKGESKNIIGQSLTIRQRGKDGAYDRLTFDNIEINEDSLETLSQEEQAQILQIYKKAGEQAIQKDKKFLGKLLKQKKITQEQYDRLVLKEVVAGTGYNDLEGLDELPETQSVVPDEAFFKYKRMHGQQGEAWIDSAGGKAPKGSNGIPVVLARMNETDLKQIEQRKKNAKPMEKEPTTKDVPLWYGKVGKVQTFQGDDITPEKIELVKQIERIAYREEQQMLNYEEVSSIDDIEYEYGIDNATIKIGSNNDWYLIYGERQKKVQISALAVVGGFNAQKKEYESKKIKSNPKLAVAESANELYGLLIEASKKGKTIMCNATEDTSLVNIERMAQKGCIKLKSRNGKNIEYIPGKGLVYSEDGRKVETRDWDEDGRIQMIDLEIIPDLERISEEKKKIDSLLMRTQEMAIMQGVKKEEGLDEMREKIREEKLTYDER